jgi:hypothetical protein
MKWTLCGLAEVRDVSNDGKIADHVLIHEEVRWRASSWFQWLINGKLQRNPSWGSAGFQEALLREERGCKVLRLN